MTLRGAVFGLRSPLVEVWSVSRESCANSRAASESSVDHAGPVTGNRCGPVTVKVFGQCSSSTVPEGIRAAYKGRGIFLRACFFFTIVITQAIDICNPDVDITGIFKFLLAGTAHALSFIS